MTSTRHGAQLLIEMQCYCALDYDQWKTATLYRQDHQWLKLFKKEGSGQSGEELGTTEVPPEDKGNTESGVEGGSCKHQP
jgi:hypothetical protein